MRHVVMLFVAISCITSEIAASQTRSGGPAAGQPTVRACAVLTRDLVAPFTENKKILDLIPPQEEASGRRARHARTAPSGCSCFRGVAGNGQCPPRTSSRFPELVRAGTSAQPGSLCGADGLDGQAFPRSPGECAVRTTAEAIKPDVVALANAIIAKLP